MKGNEVVYLIVMWPKGHVCNAFKIEKIRVKLIKIKFKAIILTRTLYYKIKCKFLGFTHATCLIHWQDASKIHRKPPWVKRRHRRDFLVSTRWYRNNPNEVSNLSMMNYANKKVEKIWPKISSIYLKMILETSWFMWIIPNISLALR